MDYIKLKRTLTAAFDHFLSCHDMAELEEMMHALEEGKKLVIQFPEPIHREDYSDDVLAHEGYKDDIAFTAPPVKKTRSYIKRKKANVKIKAAVPEKTKHICDIPVFMDMSTLSHEKQKQLRQALETDQHNIVLKDIMIKGQHILAMTKVSVPISPPKIQIQKSNIIKITSDIVRANKQTQTPNRIKEKKITLFHDKKQYDPP